MGKRGNGSNEFNDPLKKRKDHFQTESDQRGNEYRLNLEESIRELELKQWVDRSIKALFDGPLGNQSNSSQDHVTEDLFKETALKIADEIHKETKSHQRTSGALKVLAKNLELLGVTRDVKIHLFPESDEAVENNLVRVKEKLLGSTAEWYVHDPIARYEENRPLFRLAEKFHVLSDDFFNRRTIVSDHQLEADDDPEATPNNLFTWKRITNFIGKLPNTTMRYAYLLDVRRKFIQRDPSGNIKSGSETQFSGDNEKDFLQKLEAKIAIFERTHGAVKTQFEDLSNISENDEGEKDETGEPAKHVTNRTEEQVFLALEFLFRRLGASGSKKSKGIVISFLSGYSAESARKALSSNERHKNHRENVSYVLSMFREAGMAGTARAFEKEAKDDDE